MPDWMIELINNGLFPIAVAGYLLMRLEGIIKGLQKSVDNNTKMISIMMAKEGHYEQGTISIK